MTRDETIKILSILKAAYPASYRGMNKDEANGTVMVWAAQFADVPADIVMLCVQKHIAKSQFAPAISEIRAELRGLYVEAHFALAQNKTFPRLDEETVAQMRRIEKVCGKFYPVASGTVTLTDLLDTFKGNFLSAPE